MERNKVYAIVEEHGEANSPVPGQKPAVTILLQKVLGHLQCWTLYPSQQPWRMRSCGDFFHADTRERTLRAHKNFLDCAAVLVLFDLDDACPAQKGPEIAARIRAMEPLPFTVTVVCAKREYEGWFLAGLESIHPGNIYPDDPENIRGAKQWLGRHFDYRETRDQANYTQRLDVDLTRSRSRSFQRLHHALQQIIAANESQQTIITP
jgi:hypothetical protein